MPATRIRAAAVQALQMLLLVLLCILPLWPLLWALISIFWVPTVTTPTGCPRSIEAARFSIYLSIYLARASQH